MNSNSLLITKLFKIYKIHSQLTEINWVNILIFVLNMKAIFAVMNTIRAAVKTRPGKNSGLYGI